MNVRFLFAPLALSCALSLTGCGTGSTNQGMTLYEVRQQRTVQGRQALAQLAKARVILVGEQHTSAADHRAQLEVIRYLHEAGVPLAIGLEMFRHDSQADLDRWVSGRMDEAQFKPVFLDNWNSDWQLYRPIFEYARRQGIPMVGLNVPSEVSRQVALHGFQSLTPEQRGSLDNITCNVSPSYREFVQRAHEMHGHGGISFENFCEAQLLWDTAMATNAVKYLTDHPGVTMVILAGSGHARKAGIPAQIHKLAPLSTAVIIPETGTLDRENVDASDADWLMPVS